MAGRVLYAINSSVIFTLIRHFMQQYYSVFLGGRHHTDQMYNSGTGLYCLKLIVKVILILGLACFLVVFIEYFLVLC